MNGGYNIGGIYDLYLTDDVIGLEYKTHVIDAIHDDIRVSNAISRLTDQIKEIVLSYIGEPSAKIHQIISEAEAAVQQMKYEHSYIFELFEPRVKLDSTVLHRQE